MSAVLSGITRATNDECAEDSALYSRKRVLLKKAAPEFFSGAAVKTAPKLLWPWWRCSLFGFFLSTLWLAWGALTCSGHSSSRRPAGLIKARTWLSRATRFARRRARRWRTARLT